MADWSLSWYYKNFTRDEVVAACEQDNQADLVEHQLLEALDDFRDELNAPIIFSPARGSLFATSGHSEKSYHYQGKAADIMFPQTPLLEAFFSATRFIAFGGIGIYPYWKPDAGLHVDIRPASMRAYWWRDKRGKYYWLHDANEIRALMPLLIAAD